MLLLYIALARQVLACHLTCQSCSGGTTANDCSSCYAHAHLPPSSTTGTCTCDDNYFPNANSSLCSLCDVNCFTCDGSSSSSCLSCAPGAILNTGTKTCSCYSGFTPTPNAGHCVSICDPTCLDCSVSGLSGCTACFANAHLVAGSPSACACDSMTFPTPTIRDCTGCHASCATCSGTLPTQCLTCLFNAHLDTGECKCNFPFVPSPDARFCVICDLSCLTCSIAGVNGCTTCKPFSDMTGAAPSACVCKLGYWREAPNFDCFPCSSICLTCTGISATQCLTCYLNASLLSAAPSTCVCDSQHYPTRSTNDCLPCNAQCYDCVDSGANQCLSCQSNAALVGTAPCACSCNSHFYPNPDPRLCSLCDSTCLTCSSSGPNGCITCLVQAELRTSPPSQCFCKAGFTPSPTSANCLTISFCHSACLTCLIPFQEDGCLSCKHPAIIQGNGPSHCLCSAGYFGPPDACIPCHPTCTSCASFGPLVCTGCKPLASLSGASPAMCKCDPGTYSSPDSSNCVLCPYPCKSCSEKICAECVDGFFLTPLNSCSPCPNLCKMCISQDACRICMPGYSLTYKKACEHCEDCEQPLIPLVTSPYHYMYKIEFNRAVHKAFNESDFIVETDPASVVNWTVAPGSELLIRISGGPWDNSTVFTLIFTHTDEIADLFENPLSVSEVTLPPPLHSIIIPPVTNSSSIIDSPVISSRKEKAEIGLVATYMSFAIASITIAVISGAGALAIPLLSHFAFCSYLGNTGLPASMGAYLNAMNLNAIYHRFADMSVVDNTRRLSDNQLASGSSYFHSITVPVALLFILLLCHCVLRIMSLFKVKLKQVNSCLPLFEWSCYFHYMGIFSLDIAVTSLYAMIYGSSAVTSLGLWGSTMSAVICLFLLLLFTLLTAVFTVRNMRELVFLTEMRSYSAIMSHLRRDKLAVAYFYLLTLSHRLLYAAVFVLFDGYFLAQSLAFSLVELCMFLYVATVQPYEQPVIRRLHLIANTDILLAILTLVITAAVNRDSVEPLTWVSFAFLIKASICFLLMPISTLILRYFPVLKRLFSPVPTHILPIVHIEYEKTPPNGQNPTCLKITTSDSEVTHKGSVKWSTPPNTPPTIKKKKPRTDFKVKTLNTEEEEKEIAEQESQEVIEKKLIPLKPAKIRKKHQKTTVKRQL